MAKTTGQPDVKELTLRIEIPTAVDMESLGAGLARNCPSGCCILLQGPLGAGKTTLVRGFLRALGYTGTVKSPTYTLVEPYYLENFTVNHFDFYRITSPEELEFIGWRDYFDHTSLCLVEWPENAGMLSDQADLLAGISLCEQGRQVTLQALSPAGKTLIHHLS